MTEKKIAWDVVYAALDLMVLTVSVWLSFRATKKSIRIAALIIAIGAVAVLLFLPIYD